MSALVVAATVFAVGCGGGQETAPASGPASGATPPAGASRAPEPPREIPATVFTGLEGAAPPSDGDRRELYDVSRDLQNIARGEASATDDLRNDLKRYLPSERADAAAAGIATAVSTALKGKTLDEPTAQRLTAALYMSMQGDDMTATQHAAATRQLREVLGTVGAAKPQVDAVVSNMPTAAVR